MNAWRSPDCPPTTISETQTSPLAAKVSLHTRYLALTVAVRSQAKQLSLLRFALRPTKLDIATHRLRDVPR